MYEKSKNTIYFWQVEKVMPWQRDIWISFQTFIHRIWILRVLWSLNLWFCFQLSGTESCIYFLKIRSFSISRLLVFIYWLIILPEKSHWKRRKNFSVFFTRIWSIQPSRNTATNINRVKNQPGFDTTTITSNFKIWLNKNLPGKKAVEN